MLNLPTVTLVCVDTVNHELALRAIALSCAQVRFARAVFVTAAMPEALAIPDGVEVVTIEKGYALLFVFTSIDASKLNDLVGTMVSLRFDATQ